MSSRAGWRDGVAFLGFVVLALVFTYPLVLQLRTHLGGAGDDPWIFYWNNWWTRQALEEGTSLYWTPYLYYPQGASLVYHSFSWTNSLLALALERFVGSIAAYNLVLIFGYAFSGWGTYVLVVYLTGRRGAAFAAGLALAFSPYRITQASHPMFVTIGWLPLFLLFLIRAVREGRLAHAVVAGLFLALTGLTAWHLFIFAWMTLGICIVYLLLWQRACLTARSWGMIALAAIVGLALVIPALYPLLEVELGGQADEEIYVPQDERTQTDLLAYVVPNRLQPVCGDLFTPVYDRFQKNRNYVAFLGFTVIALALVGVWRARRKALPWVLLAGFYTIMALGPVLRFNGQLYPGMPMPYRLLGWTPFVRLLKQPDRFNLVLGLPIAVLVGYGICALQDRWGARLRQGWQWVIPTACAMLIAWEYVSVPMWTISTNHPPVVDRLRSEEGEFAVLDLPMGRAADKRYLYYQTIHERPIVGGHISRPLPGTFDTIDASPLLSLLSDGLPVDLEDEALAQEMANLGATGIRYIILHKGRAPAVLEADWRERFEPWQAYQDDWVLVYATTEGTGL